MSRPFLTAIVRDADGWYRYSDPLAAWQADAVADVPAVLAQIERQVEEAHCYVVGYVSYEAACAFDPSYTTHAPGHVPLTSFTAYGQRERWSFEHVATNLPEWQATEARDSYQRRFALLKDHIGAGDVYQVNFTTRLRAGNVDPLALMAGLAAGAGYGAYLETAEAAIVSASPELFFALEGSRLTCKPMKGTWPRGLSAAEDLAGAERLATSAKNRAENLMITDMVRNDLGRIARTGSVQTDALFAVAPYPRVWQMTSTVTADTDASLTDIFRALFPGASITGAPKHASMALIRKLEKTPRGIYTGAIGVLAPARRYRFNIAIRTAWIDKVSNVAEYGVGGGIVWDSEADEEYAELLSKAPQTRARPSFELLETMRAEAGEICRFAGHRMRLAASAKYFGFTYDDAAVVRHAEQTLAALPPAPHRLRLTLDRNGAVSIGATKLSPDPAVQPVALARGAVDINDPLLYHKTTYRQVYEAAAAQVPAACEALLFNRAGCVTESAIANVVYELDGKLYTPPLADGLLPGTLRAELLAAGRVQERSLPLVELADVDALWLINALRGWRRATLVGYAAARGAG